MTQEEKSLLLKDLCARLPYGVKVNYYGTILTLDRELPSDDELENEVKPYLRSMSSMTEKEKEEFVRLQDKIIYNPNRLVTDDINEYKEFIYKRHFDDRHFIEKGLALKVPEGMYKTE